jgi:parallel beta-helix repeat protein
MPSHRLSTLCVFGLLSAGAAVLVAGPLDPPVGPVSSTYKTLSEVEPRVAVNATNTPGDAESIYRIGTPGSYYLTGNIQGEANKHGIKIASGGVFLDLSGFRVLGVGQSLDGISFTAPTTARSVSVVNGTVAFWGGDGVELSGKVTSCRVQGLLVSNNGGDGIVVAEGSVVLDCSSSENTDEGIVAGAASTIRGCSARVNGGIGLVGGTGGTISDCSAVGNGQQGIFGPQGSTISNCSARDNLADGILAYSGSVSHCSAVDNHTCGIRVTNIGDGGVAVVTGCLVEYNLTNGIDVTQGTSVLDCAARSNFGDGIACTVSCLIRGNNSVYNSGAGVLVSNIQNRIEGNTCVSNDVGIQVSGTGNIVMRNACSGNTPNWSIVAGNSVAPIVLSPVNAALISGNTYTGSLGVADGNANFTY